MKRSYHTPSFVLSGDVTVKTAAVSRKDVDLDTTITLNDAGSLGFML